MRVKNTAISRRNFDLSTSLATLYADSRSIGPVLHIMLLKGYLIVAISLNLQTIHLKNEASTLQVIRYRLQPEQLHQ